MYTVYTKDLCLDKYIFSEVLAIYVDVWKKDHDLTLQTRVKK